MCVMRMYQRLGNSVRYTALVSVESFVCCSTFHFNSQLHNCNEDFYECLNDAAH